MKNYLIMVALSVFMLSQSCSIRGDISDAESTDYLKETNTMEQESSSDNVVLGKKLINPYSVENMQIAKNKLASRGVSIEEEITTTHYYIRFTPKSQEEADKLHQDKTLSLYYTPLDYEILSPGSKYRDNDIPDDQPNALYCAVPVDKELPDVSYEIIEKLYLPETSDNDSRSVSKLRLLEDESLILTGNAEVSNRSSRGKWNPNGRITLYEPTSNKNIGIPYVKVRARNWFKDRIAYTDHDGKFETESFYGDVSYTLIWELNNGKIDVRDGNTGQAWYNGPNNKKSSWNKNFASGSSYFYAQNYRAAILAYSVMLDYRSSPIGKVSICAHYGDKAPGDWAGYYEAKYRNIHTYTKFSNGNNIRYIDNLINTTHEMGHAMHHYMNKDYDDVNLRIKEAYAVFIGYLTMRVYYNIHSLGTQAFWTITRQNRSYPATTDYIPLFVDLVDDYNQYSRMGSHTFIDDVKNYDIKSLIDIVGDRSVEKMSTLISRIKEIELPAGTQASDRDVLLNQYTKNYTIREPFYKWNMKWVHTNDFVNLHRKPYVSDGVEAWITKGRLHTYISDRGNSPNSIIAARDCINLKPNKTYTVTFRAGTESGCSRHLNIKVVEASYSDDGYGWTNYTPYTEKKVLLTGTMESVSLSFTVPKETNFGTVTFEMGNFDGDEYSADVILDDFYLEES